MAAESNSLKVDIENIDLFPVIIDYDFIKMRPRGGSCRIDLFMYGKLAAELDNVKVMSNLFIKKKNMIFSKGIFLVDFSKIDSEADNIVDMIKNIGSDTIYIENSNKYDLKLLIDKLKDFEIIFLDF